MSVLIRHRAVGLTEELYDQVAGPLIESVKQSPGFILHVAFTDAKGFCVAELWDSQEQHDSWFDANVKPNVPLAIDTEVVQIHALHTA